jgi:hypothetical protein
MTKTRLKSKFLERAPTPAVSLTSHRATLVWRWLQSVKPGTDEAALAVRAMRDRKDMNNQFANRTQLFDYMIRNAKIDTQLASRTVYYLWQLYSQYRDAELHNTQSVGVKTTQRLPAADPSEYATPVAKRGLGKWLSR